DLSNRAFGFLRYANGDVASWDPDPAPCPCGVSWPRLEKVHGRSSDFLTTPAGLRVHGEWFTHLFYGRDDVLRFQLHQTALDHVALLTEGPADEAALADVLAAIRKRLGDGVTLTWKRVDRIETGPSGKHRFTVSDVPFLAGP
ncbi:MAG: phenylacetate--CoA ligase family protein, partial [Planctomycetes bacterium]|nr:phenylacetate--CoA ligase family protein [Planctomycetota bacterium]